MKLTRRFLALLLAFSMSLSMVTPAFASEVETVAETEAEAVVEEIAAVEAEAAYEAVEGTTEASDDGSDETTAGSDETTEGSDETTEATEPAGSENNPLYPDWAWNDAQTEATATVTVPAGTTYYVAVIFDGLEMSIDGGEAVAVNGSRYFPEIHTITNDGELDAEYVLSLSVPVGSQSNPEVVWDLSAAVVNIAEGDSDGYYLSYYNRAATATLVLTPSCAEEGVEYDVILTNMSDYSMAWLSDSTDGTVSMAINPGDMINIQVVTAPDANWIYPAATISLNGEVVYPIGSQMNPEIIWSPNFTASLEEGDQDGYYYSYYNRAVVGTLVLTPSCDDESVEYDVILTNMTDYSMAWLSDSTDGTVSIAINPSDYITIQVVAAPDENWVYPAAEITVTGEIVYPEGSSSNPEIIWDPTDVTATIAEGDSDGYYYSYYNRAVTGSLVFAPSCAEEGVEYDVILTNMTDYSMAWLSDSTDGTVSIAINPGDMITIQVVTAPDANWIYPAATISLNGSIEYPEGSSENPEIVWDLSTAVVNIAEGDQDGYYLSFYNRAATATLVLAPSCAAEGVEYDVILTNMSTYEMAWLSDSTDGTVSIAINPGDMITIQVATMPDENWVYPAAEIALNGEIVYPEGSSENPEIVWDLSTAVVNIAEGDQDGYYLSFYNRAATATLVLAPSCAAEGVEYDVVLTNMSNYSMAWLSDSTDGTVSIAINPGDMITIQVVTMPDANWVYPAAEIALNGEIVYPEGTSENPEVIWDPTAVTAVIAEGDNDGYYYSFYNRGITGALVYTPSCATEGVEYDVVLTNMTTYEMAWLSDSTDGTVSIAINPGDTIIIQVVTLPDANWVYPAAEIALNGEIRYPVGSQNNPDALNVYTVDVDWDESVGQNIATVEANSWSGYMYTWTADAEGELTITMSNGKAGWSYSLCNLSAGIYCDSHYSCDTPAVASETIAVQAGDEIQLIINSCGAEPYGETPAGDVYFNATFEKTVGTESNPYQPEWNWNDNWTEGTAEVTVPAGTDIYYIGITSSGMLMTINGGEAVEVNGSWYVPQVFELTNETEEDVVYSLHIYYPEGTVSTPTAITEGTITKELEDGSQGWYYIYTAPDRGVVTVTINEGETGWQYCVNNMTSWIYGDKHWSDDETVVTTETINVNKGDELQIFVNTYDPDMWWSSPAGTVSFEISFEAALGTELNPNWIYDASVWQWTEVPANSSVYFSAYGIGGMEMYVNAEPGMSVEVNGEVYAADKNGVIYLIVPASANPRMPVSFAITNGNDWDSAVGFGFYYSVGSMSNPAEMVLGKKNTASIEAGNAQGYFFTWIATGNGYLEFTMNTKTGWTYAINNLSAYSYGDTHWSDDSPVATKSYVKVSKGDEIQIMVNTYDPNSWNTPAGKIEFTPKLIVSYTETLLAGKNTTLKYIDSATGKAVSASKVEWSMTMADGTEVPASIATLKAGKLTADKSITEPTIVVVTGTYEGVAYQYNVTIYPAATSVAILDAEGNDVSGKTLTLVVNEWESWPQLSAVVGPEGACDEIVWKSSSEKVAGVSNGYVYPNASKGSVTITATAADGSGKKATVKVNVITEVTLIGVTSKTGFYTVGAGKALTMVATTNADATNNKVDWSIKMWNDDYTELVDVPSTVATINSSGKLTAAKGVNDWYDICVIATAKDGSETTGESWVTVLPVASKVEITGAPEGNTYDMNYWWPAFNLGANVLDADGNYISGDVTWKSSSDKIATIDEYGTVTCVKPGTVTFTATANDGSGKKASVKITIVKSPSMIEMPSEEEILAAGKTLTLKPNVLDADASDKKLNWNLYLAEMTEYGPDFVYDENYERIPVDSSVATLKNGKLAAAKKLDEVVMVAAVAEAQLGDAEGTCFVTLYPGVTNKISIMSNGAVVGKSVDLTSGKKIVLYAEADAEMAANVYTWTSSNESVATVESNPDGSVTVKVHALKTSKATITATAVDGTNKKASVTVNVTVNAVALEMDRQYVVAGKSIDLSKQIRFVDYDGCAITPANKTVSWTLWVRKQIMDENGEPVLSPEGLPCYEWHPAEDNKCEAATLNSKTGALKTNKVTEFTPVIINAEYVNSSGETVYFSQGVPVWIYPAAAKGVELYGCDGVYDDTNFMKLDKKNVTTTESQILLNPVITNYQDDVCWDFDITVDNAAFAVTFEEFEIQYHDENGDLVDATFWFYVLRPVDESNPYGTVKVTIKTIDGSNKSTYFTANFVAP